MGKKSAVIVLLLVALGWSLPCRAQAVDSLAKGRALFDRALAAAGGVEALAKVRSIAWLANSYGPNGEQTAIMRALMLPPDTMRINVATQQGMSDHIMLPTGTFMAQSLGVKRMPAESHAQLREDLWHNALYLLIQGAREEFLIKHVGEQENSDLVLVEPPGDVSAFGLYLDKESGLPLAIMYQSVDEQTGEFTTEMDIFSDFREVEGVQVPFQVEYYLGEELSTTVVYQDIRFNTEVDRRIFDIGG